MIGHVDVVWMVEVVEVEVDVGEETGIVVVVVIVVLELSVVVVVVLELVVLELVEVLVVLVVLVVELVIGAQSPEVTTLSSKVIAAPAYKPPSIVAPVTKLIEACAKMLPANAVVEPSVAELATAQ